MKDWVDLALDAPDPFTPQRHELPAGEYRFAVLQICLQVRVRVRVKVSLTLTLALTLTPNP